MQHPTSHLAECLRLWLARDPSSVTLHAGAVRWRLPAPLAKSALFEELKTLLRNSRPPADDPIALRRKRWSFQHATACHQSDLHVKCSVPRNLRESIKYGLRPTRAASEWRNSLRLRRAGVPVPTRIALAERRRAWLWRQSVYVAEHVGDGRTLLGFSISVCDARQRRRVIEALATAVADMHRAGLYHRDLHGNNVLIEADVPLFLDLHEMWPLGWRLKPLCIADLGRLNTFVAATPRERQRFLLRYLKRLGVRRNKTDWQRKIDRKTGRLRRYYADQGYDFSRF